MRDYERFAVVMVLGSVAAYAAGMIVRGHVGAFWVLSLVFVIEILAVFLGWIWAQAGWRS